MKGMCINKIRENLTENVLDPFYVCVYIYIITKVLCSYESE